MSTHRERILDQFTRQAVPFSNSPAIRDQGALELVVRASGATADDAVLDVACGPGLLVAAFARVARQVTGIDVTAAMIARAREVTAGLANVRLDCGEALPLPYAAASFEVVASRFAFHHFEDPAAVLAQMRRVCRPGGRVVVCDLMASADPAKAAAFHRVECMRDPSHARALTLDEQLQLFAAVGLPPPAATFYRMEFELEGLLARSFPRSEDLRELRSAYYAAVDDDALGLGLHRREDKVYGSYHVAILVASPAG